MKYSAWIADINLPWEVQFKRACCKAAIIGCPAMTDVLARLARGTLVLSYWDAPQLFPPALYRGRGITRDLTVWERV